MSKQLRIWLFVLLGTLLTSTSLLAEGIITMTTSKSIGGHIFLRIEATGNVTIEGAQELGSLTSDYGNEYVKVYEIKNQTITVRGDVTELYCGVPDWVGRHGYWNSRNSLTSLDVSGCTTLTKLNCFGNQLTSLDVSKNTALTTLECYENQLTSLDVSGCTALTMLACYNNQLTSLDVSQNTALTTLGCSNNQLTSLDVSKNTALTILYCGGNQLTSLDVSKNTALTWLNCRDNQLTSLDVSKNTALTTLYCANSRLTSLDVSGCTALTELDCDNNRLTSLNLSGCTSLTTLNCQENQLTSLNVSGCTALTKLECLNNQLTSLDVSGCTSLKKLNYYGSQLTSLNVSGCTALEELSCYGNQLTSLDVSQNTALTELYCGGNQLTSLNVSGCTALAKLDCSYNQLTSLNVSGCTALTKLYCYKNQLSSLPLPACISLTYLGCSDNQLTSLDVSDCKSLKSLNCTRNKIKSAEMSQLINSLPNRKGYESGSLYVVDKRAPTEENFCYQYDIEVARNKNWSSSYSGEPNRTCSVTKTLEGKGSLSITGAVDLGVVAYGTELTVVATPEKNYELVALTANGVDITATKKFLVKDDVIVKAVFKGNDFKVSLEQDGEGDLSVTGVDNLNEVPYGTELTIIANPKKGYELTSLIANGINITNTKKVTVRGNLTIKATFTQKTRNFAVKLTKEGEGTISATGATSLNAVAYGTELTIVATPAAGYKLTALTANGQDILATKKVVIKGATEVKATFANNTGVATTVTQQTQLYPNPATDYVIVEGVVPASEVTLHNLTGERLYAGRADSRGTLQIDLTPYADGVYLVCVAGETYRVVVRR